MTWTDEGRFGRRELLRRGVIGAGSVSALGLLAGCGSGSSGDSPKGKAQGSGPAISPGPTGGQPKHGGRLVVAALGGGSTESLNPQKSIVTPDFLRALAMYDPLYLIATGGLQPALAQSAEPNKDASVWTLKLRPGVHWHDGKPFTADDVLYTLSTWRDPNKAYFAGTAASTIDLKKVRKLDAMTVEVPLLRPTAELPSLLANPYAIMIQDGFKNWDNPVGTGAFKYKSFKAGASSTHTANPDYWRGKPYVDELVFDSSYTEDTARLNAVLGGAAHIAPNVPPALAKAQAGSGRVVLGNSPGPGTITPVMRVNVAPFNDPQLVKAFKLLTNRQQFISSVYDGYATPGNDVPFAHIKYWAKDIKAEYDPEKAKSLLKAAGHENMAIELVTSPQVPGMIEAASLWASQAAAAGVKAKVRQIPVSTYYTATSNPAYLTDKRTFAMTYWQAQASLTAAYLFQLTGKSSFNDTGWGKADPSQDKLTFDAIAELDPAKAADKWHAVQEQQAEKGGYIIPANTNFVDAYASNVGGGNTTIWGDNCQYDYAKTWLT
jgi:peptide/nickel transport system substrate-binding protein